jgi:hypothetical protein
MRTLVRILGVGTLLALGVWFWTGAGGAAGNGNNMIFKPVLDDASTLKLIKEQLQLISEELPKLSKGAREARKAKKRIQVSAAYIVVFVKSSKPGADKQLLAAYLDGALKLNQAAGDDSAKAPALAKLAGDLANVKADANAKDTAVDWKKVVDDLADVMQPFKLKYKGGDGISANLMTNQKLKGKGGNGIEEKVRALARRKLTDAQMKKEAEDIALMSDKIAAIGHLAYEWVPKQEGKKNPKDWKEWSTHMRDIALDLSAAARKGSAEDVFKFSQKLNANCNQCHGIFKPE